MEQSTRKLQSDAAGPLAPASAQATGHGSALYVINLCASMTPIAHGDKAIPGFENYRIYQVSRKEDGRVRYRLRLGFFTDQAEAETALALIRDHYPTAFATSLSDDDQRHSRSFTHAAAPTPSAKTTAAPVAKAVQPAAPVNQPIETKPAPAAAAAVAAKDPAPAATIATQPTPTKANPPAASAANDAAAKAASKTSGVTSTHPAAQPTNIPSAGLKEKAASTPASDTQRVPALKIDKALEVEFEWEAPAASTMPATPPAPVATAPAKTDKSAPTVASKPVAPTTTEPKVELTLATEAAAPAANPSAARPSSEPFHVGKGVDIPASALSLTLEQNVAAGLQGSAPAPKVAPPTQPPSKPTPATAATKAAPAKPATPATKHTPVKPAATPNLPKPPVVVGDDVPLPELDSTQTIRALTPQELDDENQPKWFAVQLAVSEQPINLDTMPHLDIFAAYSLYSVATAGSGKILHHMRIGFFKEQVSADAVSGYLKTFFANPTVLRISVAEYKRFSEGPKPQVATDAKAKVIDIAAARDRTPVRDIPVVTMEVVNPSTTGRFPKPNIEASGVHKQPPAAKPMPKPSVAAKTAARSTTSPSSSGKHKTLQEALLAEAREVELSESAIRRLPKNSSLLSKLFGKK